MCLLYCTVLVSAVITITALSTALFHCLHSSGSDQLCVCALVPLCIFLYFDCKRIIHLSFHVVQPFSLRSQSVLFECLKYDDQRLNGVTEL